LVGKCWFEFVSGTQTGREQRKKRGSAGNRNVRVGSILLIKSAGEGEGVMMKSDWPFQPRVRGQVKKRFWGRRSFQELKIQAWGDASPPIIIEAY
jgi:hypothetical protein